MLDSPAQKETRHAETMLPDSVGSGQAGAGQQTGVSQAGHAHCQDTLTLWGAASPPKHGGEMSAAHAGSAHSPQCFGIRLCRGWLVMENFQKDSLGLHTGRNPDFKTLNI